MFTVIHVALLHALLNSCTAKQNQLPSGRVFDPPIIRLRVLGLILLIRIITGYDGNDISAHICSIICIVAARALSQYWYSTVDYLP